MKKTIYLFALAGLSLAACGDNQKATVDGNGSNVTDGSNMQPPPPPPTLGAQIDRMGRPAINTALNHAFDPNLTAKGSAKDAYNKDGSVGTWQQTWVPTFAPGIAIIDAVDTGVCGNGLCESIPPGIENNALCPADCPLSGAINTQDGCGNLPTYAPGSNGLPAPTSYVTLAGILADDELYLDTSKTACNAYLSLEFSYVTHIPVSSCGGRAPSYDVIDTSYSLLTRGLSGFDPSTLMPLFGDNATGPVTGTTDAAFPFLAAPH